MPVQFKERVNSQKILLVGADSSFKPKYENETHSNRTKRQISFESVPFEFKIDNEWEDLSGSRMIVKLCKKGCSSVR